MNDMAVGPQLDLFWIPLGAGARVVRTSGRGYEACAALAHNRPVRPLFHSALVASLPEGRYTMEMTPIPRVGAAADRGVVGEGAVGSRLLGRFRVFRYELRRWLDGSIPDLPYAVDSPVSITADEADIRRVLALLGDVPTPVWGRDELHAGEMWNSNSVISWVLARAGVLDRAGSPPRHGRAPGWDAGIRVADRHRASGAQAAARRPNPDKATITGTTPQSAALPSPASTTSPGTTPI